MNKRGQFRIIEALTTTILVVGSMIMALGIQRIPRTWITYEREDLKEMAFNLLAEIADPVLSSELATHQDSWESNVFWALNTMLPPTMYFNMTIYEVSLSSEGEINLETLNKTPITNIQGEEANRIAEAASAIYIFTSPDGKVYMALLTLARSRGG